MRKRIRGEIQQQQKEDLDGGNHHRRMSKQANISFVTQPQYQSVAGKQQRPEKQRAFLPRPQRRKLVRQWQVAIAVMKDVGDRKVVAERRRDQHHGPEKHAPKLAIPARRAVSPSRSEPGRLRTRATSPARKE